MTDPSIASRDLPTLNDIARTLNRAADVHAVLHIALARLIDLLGLQTGWIFVRDSTATNRWAGRGYHLAASHNLPPALALDNPEAWRRGCDCQGLCERGELQAAYNEVRCSRLAAVSGDKNDLAVHASVPLQVAGEVLGILNVAAPDWSDFDERALALLTNVGLQMGEALERARLFDQLRDQRLDEQDILLEFSNQLLGQTTPDDLVRFLVQRVRHLLEADAAALFLCDEQDETLHCHTTEGWRQSPPDDVQSLRRLLPVQAALDEGRTVLSRNADQASLPDWLAQEDFCAHACVPMASGERLIGILMLSVRRPRDWSEDDLRLVNLMANQAAIALETARLQQEVFTRQRLEHELAVARDIQLSLLPHSIPQPTGWGIAAYYQAARQVGGDFYDVFTLPDSGQLGLAVADVAGKGMPAALIMALSRTMLRTAAFSYSSPQEALHEANHLLYTDNDNDFFLTACYAVLDPASGQLALSSAGHNPPVWLQAASGQASLLSVPGTVLGVFETIPLNQHGLQLAPGDALVFYTDGVTEAMTPAGELFGEARLQQTLAAQPTSASAQQLVEAVQQAVQDFRAGADQSDDITLLVLKRDAQPTGDSLT